MSPAAFTAQRVVICCFVSLVMLLTLCELQIAITLGQSGKPLLSAFQITYFFEATCHKELIKACIPFIESFWGAQHTPESQRCSEDRNIMKRWRFMKSDHHFLPVVCSKEFGRPSLSRILFTVLQICSLMRPYPISATGHSMSNQHNKILTLTDLNHTWF